MFQVAIVESLYTDIRGWRVMKGQQTMIIKPSNITKLGFVECKDCNEQFVCPHFGHREGCRTKEVISEVADSE